MKYRVSLLILIAAIIQGCYSLKGTSISPDVKTFYVANFRSNAPNAPAQVGQEFSDKLRDKILRETRLSYSEGEISLEFEGSVGGFNVTSVAPTSNAAESGLIGSSLNRLNISVQVDCINNVNEDDSWSQGFSFFSDFESSQNLADVQDELIETIFDQIAEDIFNKAFSDW